MGGSLRAGCHGVEYFCSGFDKFIREIVLRGVKRGTIFPSTQTEHGSLVLLGEQPEVFAPAKGGFYFHVIKTFAKGNIFNHTDRLLVIFIGEERFQPRDLVL